MGVYNAFHLNVIYSILLFLYIFFICFCIGSYLTRFLLPSGSIAEVILFNFSLGFGVLAYGIFFLGLLGFLNQQWMAVWLVVLGLFSLRKIDLLFSLISRGVKTCKSEYREILQRFESYKYYVITILTLMGLIWVFSLTMALTPPWDYDGLMYHLDAPRRFLELGKIALIPDLWGANSPMVGEMVYSIGLVFRLDIFPKIIHWFFGLAVCLITVQAGRKVIGKHHGYLALVILSGVIYFPFLASWAYIDLIWATFELLSFYCLLIWREDIQNNKRWLLLGGIFMGLSLGTKYLALTGFLVAILIIFLETYRDKKTLITSASLYIPLALLIVLPWYLKNWILGGNPFYPLFFGGKDYPPDRWYLFLDYLRGFGLGYSLKSFLLLPINVFINSKFFVTFGGTVDIPSPLFWFTLFYPLFYKKIGRSLYPLDLIVVLRTIIWFFGSQQTRFLYPIFPYLCIITSSILIELMQLTVQRGIQSIRRVLFVTSLIMTLAITVSVIARESYETLKPWRLWLGMENSDMFLTRILPPYELMKHITELSPHSKTLLIWEGRGYYCPRNCIVDAEHSNWIRIAQEGNWNIDRIDSILRRRQIGYFLIDEYAMQFLILHDPSGIRVRAHEFLTGEFLTKCGQLISHNIYLSLYEVNCRTTYSWDNPQRR